MSDFEKIMAYSPGNRKAFDELSGLCARRMVVPYIGAGMSAFVFPTWEKLINCQYKKCFGVDKPEEMGNIEAADRLESGFVNKGGDFNREVCKELGAEYKDKEWVEVLWKAESEAVSVVPKLFFGPIVTTNFDLIIEKIHGGTLEKAFPYHYEGLRTAVAGTMLKRNRILYKIHGSVEAPRDIVITKKKYDEAYGSDTELMKALPALFQGFHYLFLGCSLVIEKGKMDKPIEKLLAFQKRSEMPHYAILGCKGNIEKKRKKLESRKIFPILYREGEHESVKIILDEIQGNLNPIGNTPVKPNDNKPFIERTDGILGKIVNSLKMSEYAVLVLNGGAGVGKTRTMNEYAFRMENMYSKILSFNAVSYVSLTEEIREFVVKNIGSKNVKKPEEAAEVFKQWMTDKDNYLLLFDNADDIDVVRPYLGFGRGLEGTRHILITTRLGGDGLAGVTTVKLDVFSEEDSLAFLDRYVGREPDAYAGKISERLEYLPLALRQAAAFIKVHNETYGTYFKKLEEQPLGLLGAEHPEPGEVPVRATWNITMQRLGDGAARELLNLYAFFAPDKILDDWFADNPGILPDSLRGSIVGGCGFESVKADLGKYSLIDPVAVGDDRRGGANVHRLLQDVVVKTLKPRRGRKKALECCLRLAERIFDWKSKKTNRDLGVSYMWESAHVVRIAERYYKTFCKGWVEGGQGKPADELLEITVEIFFGNSVIHAKMLYVDKAGQYCDRCIDILEIFYKEYKEYSSAGKSLFMAYNNRGLIYASEQAYKEAIDVYEKSISLSEEIRGAGGSFEPEAEEAVALAYMNRGIAREYKKEHEKALADKESSVAMFERLCGDGRLESENGLALAYMNRGATLATMGRYREALTDINKSIEIWERMKNGEEAIDDGGLAAAYLNKSFVSAKAAIHVQKKRLSDAGAAKYHRNTADALLKYRNG
jgi:tetratricopeptide (TPR) repeat protein